MADEQQKTDEQVAAAPAAQTGESEFEQLKKQCDEYLEGWKRAKADLANYKKDEVRRLESVVQFANESIIRDMVEVLDAFDLALETLKDESKLERGIFLIRTKLEDVARRYGLERIVVSVGNPFDPALHDAIATVESDKPSGTVVDEVERGYTLYGKLIRAARVKVAK